jgi:hypothetical protein
VWEVSPTPEQRNMEESVRALHKQTVGRIDELSTRCPPNHANTITAAIPS